MSGKRGLIAHAQELIHALEAEIRERRADSASDEELPRLEQQLRLAYLESGRLDDAVSVIEFARSAAARGLEEPDVRRGRLAVARRGPPSRRCAAPRCCGRCAMRPTTCQPRASWRCGTWFFASESIISAGTREFPRKEFQPKQQVILYAEVENFAAESKGVAGFETELQGSYEILDSSGQIIASRQLQLDKEICRNYRRDYFLAYRIYMPDNISPGRYRLELTVEDLKAKGKYQGRKLGDGVIEFTIR